MLALDFWEAICSCGGYTYTIGCNVDIVALLIHILFLKVQNVMVMGLLLKLLKVIYGVGEMAAKTS